MIDACVMLPLVPVMAWLVRWLVPTREDEEELIYLEPHLLDTPALALERSVAETVFMARLAHKSIDESFHAFRDRNHTLPPGIRKREEKIDRRQEEITNYLVQLTQRDMSEVESRQLPLLIHTVNDLERIGDHAENLVELAERRVDRKLPFTETALGQLSEFFGLVDRMFELVIQAVEKADHQAAKRALEYEQKINAMEDELQRGHQKRLEAGDCNVISGVVFLDVVANLEKVGDHLTNVAEAFEASREWRELATP